MKVIQGIWGDIPDHIAPCLDSVKRFYPQVEIFKFPQSQTPIYDSDVWRWNMFVQYDDLLYIDWDITITQPLIFSDNKLFSSMVYYMDRPDNCLIYSPDKRIFKEFEDIRIRRKIKFTTIAWYRKVLRYERIHEIKYGFEHLRTSGIQELKKQYSLVHNVPML